MTAEIVVMNRSGISMAADSAVTAGSTSVKKIFTSANKIFTLSKLYPIGIMFYNLASFMGIPWEVLIKDYRHKIGNKSFSTVQDAALDFIGYLNDLEISDEIQNNHARSVLYGYFSTARDCIIEELRKKHGDNLAAANLSLTDIEAEIQKYFESEKSAFEGFEQNEFASHVSMQDFIEKYSDIISKVSIDCISELANPSSDLKTIVQEISYYIFSKRFSSNYSGIVVVGYGKDAFLPSMRSYIISGKLMNRLMYFDHVHDDISLEPGGGARIYSFAQDDMAQIFTRGVDKKYKSDMLRYFKEILGNYSSSVFEIVNEYIPEDKRIDALQILKQSDEQVFSRAIEDLNKYELDRFFIPLLRIMEVMPKEELAHLAESLVSVTALRVKVTLRDETVGGPTDVAVVTKGDGFIWIKRKHYFSPELNSTFFMNYQRRTEGE